MKKTDVCTCIERRLLKRKRSVTSYATSSTVPLAVALSTREALAAKPASRAGASRNTSSVEGARGEEP